MRCLSGLCPQSYEPLPHRFELGPLNLLQSIFRKRFARVGPETKVALPGTSRDGSATSIEPEFAHRQVGVVHFYVPTTNARKMDLEVRVRSRNEPQKLVHQL